MASIRKNFVYPEISSTDRTFGASTPSPVINSSADWRKFLPPEEEQKRGNIESSACFVEGIQHAIATIKECQYGVIDENYSARFNALLADGTEQGGNPLKSGDSCRKDGLIKDSSMPFSDDIESWFDFHSWKGVDEQACRKEGKDFLKRWQINYKLEWEKSDSLDTKYKRLREALKSSPVPMSVYGEIDLEGNYVPKPEWAQDTHMVEAVYVDEKDCIWIFDTYKPFLKKLPAKYNSDFGMSLIVKKLEEIKKKSWLQRFLNWILNL